MGKRHRSRECAVQCLYQWEVTGADPDSILSGYWEAREIDEPAVSKFAEELFRGTVEHVEVLDGIIAAQTRHWRLERLGLVEKSILRLGGYELAHEHDTPTAVVIDEAVELAKRYSGPEAAPFVNGILDAISAHVRGDRADAEQGDAAAVENEETAAQDT